jgi:hypothetical protein
MTSRTAAIGSDALITKRFAYDRYRLSDEPIRILVAHPAAPSLSTDRRDGRVASSVSGNDHGVPTCIDNYPELRKQSGNVHARPAL